MSSDDASQASMKPPESHVQSSPLAGGFDVESLESLSFKSQENNALQELFRDHNRDFGSFKYVYPVISRRAQGLSIGINLSPSWFCNFACVYCCVTERRPEAMKPDRIDLHVLQEELRSLLESVMSGDFWKHPRFAQTPEAWKVLRDLTFAGNGEPTLCPDFAAAAECVEKIRRQRVPWAQLILLTNATTLEVGRVRKALPLFVESGEIWMKLDAGTDRMLAAINRSPLDMEALVQRILNFGRQFPIVLQCLIAQVEGLEWDLVECEAWQAQISKLVASGCKIQRVQVYTVARITREEGVWPVDAETLEKLGQLAALAAPNAEIQVVL
jgi:wyosine [tRNA(Phe)-imidazoG37] synthetase (radical SAM superfamily)